MTICKGTVVCARGADGGHTYRHSTWSGDSMASHGPGLCVLVSATPDSTCQSDSVMLTAGPPVSKDPEAALGARSDVSFHGQW